MAYVVLYADGGSDRVRWNEIFIRFDTHAGADAYIRENGNFLGIKQVVLEAEAYARNGKPVGLEPEDALYGEVDEGGWWWRHGIPGGERCESCGERRQKLTQVEFKRVRGGTDVQSWCDDCRYDRS